MKKKVSFCLVGNDHLLIEAAQILLEHTYSISAVLSTNLSIYHWAQQKNLYFTDHFSALADKIKKTETDYLISIGNPQILPESILVLPKFAAVNCHNGLLPQYAGSNPNAWAILNNESHTGFTWHKMVKKIDGGDILDQKKIPIEEKDTAVSLNLKCHQSIASHFSLFIKQLVNGHYTPKIQDVKEYHYYSRKRRPLNDAWINWCWPAQTIDRLCRALNFGDYENSIALPKCQIGSEIFIIHQIEILPKKTNALPGTLCELSEHEIQVATSTQDIVLKKLMHLSGQSYIIKNCIHKFNLKVGDQLPIINDQTLSTYKPFMRKIACCESTWVTSYASFHDFKWYECFNINSLYRLKNQTYAIQLDKAILKKLSALLQSTSDQIGILESLVCIYLYKLHQYKNFSVNLYQPIGADAPYFIKNTISDWRIWNLSLKDHFSVRTLLKQLIQEYYELSNMAPHLKDIRLRYPNIKLKAEDLEKTPRLVFLKAEWIEKCLLTSEDILIGIDIQKACYHLKIGNDLLSKGFIYHFIHAFYHIVDFSKIVMRSLDQSISKIPILSKKSSIKCLYGWNNTKRSYPRHQTLLTLFKKQVMKSPFSIALSFDNKKMTYQDLDKHSDKLAQKLILSLPKQPSVVGVYMENSPLLIVSIIAVAKSGSVYLPLSPSYPKKYIQSIIADSKPILILVNSEPPQKQLIDNTTQTCVLQVDKLLKDVHLTTLSTLPKTSAQSPFYLLYTSGSTGQPNGVLIKQKSVLNLVLAQIRLFYITSETRLLQFAPINFDASISEIWTSLLSGATLCLAKRDDLLPVKPLLHTLNDYRITCVTLPPSILSLLPADQLPYLETVISAGERCTDSIVTAWSRQKRLINAYGPTEATVCTTSMSCHEGHPATCIGKPIDNMTTYVMDRYTHLLPIGVKGELYIGGDGLAIQYSNRPHLTRERFIQSPFHLSKQLYKTGDQASWLSDGTIDYKGRLDRQIKINGIRTEIGMIESYLAVCPYIHQSALEVYKDSKGFQRLVVYFVPKNNNSKGPIQNLIKNFLSEHIPKNFIPNYWIELDKMPLTVNGKINYKALAHQITRNECSVPKNIKKTWTKTELLIAKIWKKFLPKGTLSTHQSFFDLGGHSLIILPMLDAIETCFNQTVPLSWFLEHPTISGLSEILLHQTIEGSKLKKSKLILEDSKFTLSLPFLPEINRSSSTSSNPKKREVGVLLTGATGFLGTYVLSELMHCTKDPIYCLVKPNSVQQFKQSIEKHLMSSNEFNNVTEIRIIIGDLSKDHLGMIKKDYDLLTQKVNMIYHLAAEVNHMKSYTDLKNTNVLGTLELLKLATQGSKKSIYYVSTLSTSFMDNRYHEHWINHPICPASNGYLQTKWVSERLLAQAHEQGLPVKIFRPGWIIGNHQINMPEYHHLYSLIRGCIQLGYAPNWKTSLHLLPVDFVSAFIVKMGLTQTPAHQVFNLFNPNSICWTDLIHWINRSGRGKITCLSPAQWLQPLKTMPVDNPLYPFLPLYLEPGSMRLQAPDLTGVIEHHHTDEALKKLNMSYPDIPYDWLVPRTAVVQEA